jgi:hypothetical protein
MDRIKTTLSSEIELQHVYHAKPNKKGDHLIYVRFYMLHKTIKVYETLVSTGLTVPPKRWIGRCVNGTGIETKVKNDKLNDILNVVNDGLHELKKIKIKNVQTVKAEIENGLKSKITNKPPKERKTCTFQCWQHIP